MKKNIAIVFGGVSSEHEVSVETASSIYSSLDNEKYNIIKIYITKSGRWLEYKGEIKDALSADIKSFKTLMVSTDSNYHGLLKLNEDKTFEMVNVDCIFFALHGKNGEDGTVQGLCELAKIPYVGCDLNSSSNCMDKVICHTILDYNNIKGTKWVSIKREDLDNIEDKLDDIVAKLNYPIFVKPANAGSSVGISKAKNKEELLSGIKNAFLHDSKVICEKEVIGKEVECAVLGNENPKSSILGQIVSANDFYDYEAKYKIESNLLIPADLDERVSKKVRETAIKAYKIMGCSGLSRIDFLIDNDNEIYLNEINTMPGFTSISMYPKLWEKTGLCYKELLDELIDLTAYKYGELNG